MSTPPPVFNPAYIRQAARDAGGQAEVARLLGVSKETVRNWCDGRSVPQAEAIDALADELGLDALAAWLEPELPDAPVADVLFQLNQRRHVSLRSIHKGARVPLGTLSEILNRKRSGFTNPDHEERFRQFAATKLVAGKTSSWAAREKARRPCARRCAMNLSDDVLGYFKLRADPWRLDVRADKDVFATKDYQRMHKLITRAVDRRDFAVIDGPTGAGKSQMCRAIIRQVNRRKAVKLVPILAPDVRLVSASTICDALVKNLAPGNRPEIRTEKLAIQVCEILIQHHRAGNVPVILIDDAHKCTPSTLSQLKRFYEFRDVAGDQPYEPLMAIVLLGWPELSLTLANNPTLLEIARRADILQLRGLRGEHANYIQQKLLRVGPKGGRTIFQKAAVAELRRVPQAQWPLAVNRICSRAMYLAWAERKTRAKNAQGQVTADDVRHAAEEEV